MIKNLFAAMLFVMSFLMLPATGAHAQSACEGAWQSLSATSEWSPNPSTCSCFGGAPLSGGAYVSNRAFAWIWSQGRGQVRVRLEFTRTVVRGNVTSNETKTAYAMKNGRHWGAEDGLGAEGPLNFSEELNGWNWTGRFQAVCVQW
jgi:hypothetical protein